MEQVALEGGGCGDLLQGSSIGVAFVDGNQDSCTPSSVVGVQMGSFGLAGG